MGQHRHLPEQEAVLEPQLRWPLETPMEMGPSSERTAARAKEDSVDDIRKLADRVKDEYATSGQEILESISRTLEVPQNVQRFGPILQDLTTVVGGLVALAEVARWYGAGNTSLIDPKVLVAEAFAKKYLFWSLILLRIPATPTSSNPPLELLTSDRQLSVYHHVPALYGALLDIPGIAYETFPQSLRPTLIDVAIAWWAALFDSEPPMYPLGRPMDDPSHSSVDVSVSTFLRLLLPDARSMTRSIMSGIICPPKVFVHRTLRRMRLLPKLNVLAHLSRLPPCTMEIENMGILSNIAGIRDSR
ncbi:hypothetical protein FA13DRAFT_1777948, partial [Coprinellus micaceus]